MKRFFKYFLSDKYTKKKQKCVSILVLFKMYNNTTIKILIILKCVVFFKTIWKMNYCAIKSFSEFLFYNLLLQCVE